ncbi:MAG: RNA polymerase sigma factor [Planctomycetota bacterium]|jgi:RNA polymerase sigma-70 factor (ECF subfamily)
MACEHSNLEDQLLVMDAQDGDRQAMETLVRRWQKRLWQHAFRLTGNDQAAWDVTQSAWYDIIRRLPKLHDPAAFRAWVYKITTCKSIDWIKKKRPIRPISAEMMDTLTAKHNPETEINELLEKLDVDKRAILCLHYFEQLNIAEIGEVLKIPTGTVKSRLHNARKELKELWEEIYK